MNIIKTALAALCLSATCASAVTIEWAFDAFSNGNGATGSFRYDTVSDTYSDISVNLVNSGVRGGPAIDVLATYLYQSTSGTTSQFLAFSPVPPGADQTGSLIIGIFLSASPSEYLTGGTYSGTFVQTYCNIPSCGSVTFFQLFQHPMTGTPVPVSAVPLPAGGTLLLSAFGLIGWSASRRGRAGRQPVKA